jgi:hypothetical protein
VVQRVEGVKANQILTVEESTDPQTKKSD